MGSVKLGRLTQSTRRFSSPCTILLSLHTDHPGETLKRFAAIFAVLLTASAISNGKSTKLVASVLSPTYTAQHF